MRKVGGKEERRRPENEQVEGEPAVKKMERRAQSLQRAEPEIGALSRLRRTIDWPSQIINCPFGF